MTDSRSIRIKGKASIKVKPDITRITITLEGRHMGYGKTLKKSTEDTKKLKKLLIQHGFDKSDVKTLSFNIETKYEIS